jgi:4-amino-4-deoxy-L-arabinose transferase-like glycosyltransferase
LTWLASRWEHRHGAVTRRRSSLRHAGPPAHRFDRRYAVAVTLVLAVALLLRLWGDRTGLPWAYNVDEAQNFVPRAIAMLGGNLNPGYFNNPPAFTYLLAGLFKLALGGRAAHVYHSANSTEIWVIARVTSAVLGTVAVWLLYLTGARLFDRRAGLLAAAVMAVAFLPVFYGKLALNDSPTLAPVCLSLWGSAGILRHGRRRDFVAAGIGLGLAAATKYTGGIVALPLLAASLSRLRESDRKRLIAIWLPIAGALALACFIAANPYAIGDFHAFIDQLAQQSSESGEVNGKLGLTHGTGILYYLWSLSWGVGWLPAGAAAVGAIALAARRWWWTFAALVPATVAYLVFMGVQGRYFGRWVMPVIPIVCLLCACACVTVADLAARWRPRAGAALLVVLAAAMCLQGAFYSVHSGIVDSRPDTRNIARAWLLAHVPAGTRIVVEPIVPKSASAPDNWTTPPWPAFTDLLTHVGERGVLYVLAGKPVKLEDYERTLSPALVQLYLRDGYCWVVTGSTEEGRALVDPTAVPRAIAYYRELAKVGTRVFQISPLAGGRTDVGFNFDWSFEYYPADYVRPGPLVTVYHLHGGACTKAHASKHRHRRRP